MAWYNGMSQQPTGMYNQSLQGTYDTNKLNFLTEPNSMTNGVNLNGPDLNMNGIGNTAQQQTGVMGYVGAGSQLLQGLGGLANAYTAYKSLQMAKDQFKFQKGLANRNLANQAKVINTSYDNAGQVAAGMIGGGSYNPNIDTQGSYGMTDQSIVDKYTAKAKEKHVDGSAI